MSVVVLVFNLKMAGTKITYLMDHKPLFKKNTEIQKKKQVIHQSETQATPQLIVCQGQTG